MNTKEIVDCAMGRTKSDIVLLNGQLVNVYTKEIIEVDVAICKDRIVHVGKNTNDLIGENTRIINIEGSIICPGLIESHVHIESSMLTLSRFTEAIVTHGTTTAVIDPHELANVAGIDGLEILVDEVRNSPISYLIEVPSCVPSLPGFETSGATIDSEQVKQMMIRDEFFALAEMMNYPGVFLGLEEVMTKIDAAKKAGKIIEGHAPLLKGKELQAYVAAGISSDHEATTFEEVLEKLRLGMKLQVREGSFAKDLGNILQKLEDSKIDTRNMLIATDDRNPIDLMEKGHLNYTYKKMVQLGINPIEAIQMMTLNTATHLGLEKEIGGIAPGKRADIIIVNNLEEFNIEMVFAKGEVLFENGKLTFSTQEAKYPDFILDTLSNLEVPTIEKLKIKVNEQNYVNVRVIGVNEHSLITEKLEAELQVQDTFIIPDVENDILPVVVINRHTKEEKIGKGFVKGLGLKHGAIASTVAHDSHQLICTGSNYELMLKAIKALKESHGGLVVVTTDKITILPLEFAGIMSTGKIEDVVRLNKELNNALNNLNPAISESFMALAFLALPVIPHLKITDHGLIDVDIFEKVNPVITE
ncbi:MAG: adenine deaminase [Candidatus Heimdallarchaeota archaeon]|nr:adenine deaminase [Candidatus Heimdallarchaeota archaeon]MCK4769623.1 adenine deaminase [Candidatus Heimdallarchaeota archaeon]